MTRRQLLVAYDIADDKRRTRIYKRLLDEGERIQYSVFLCECSRTERLTLVSEIETIIHHTEDQVIFLDLGPSRTNLERSLHCVGKQWTPPTRIRIV